MGLVLNGPSLTWNPGAFASAERFADVMISLTASNCLFNVKCPKHPAYGENNAHAWPRSGLEDGGTVGGTWRSHSSKGTRLQGWLSD